MFWINGIIVATNGMLSRTEETSAESQSTSSDVFVTSPSVSATAPVARSRMTPVSLRPPTATKRPMKKKMVAHSTLRIEKSTSCWLPPASSKAPNRATTDDSICVNECVKKPRIVRPSTKSERASSLRSFRDFVSSICMISACSSGFVTICLR